jgi:hypothetical protein
MQEFEEWMRIAEAQKGGTAGHDADGVRALFYKRPVLDPKATEIEGYPVYVTKPYVEIRIPGDPRSVVNREVKEEHKIRFPKAWEAFERGHEGAVDGTPIDLFPALTVEQVASLKHSGVLTIEQLAAVPDDALPRIGPNTRTLRERAQQHLKGASETERDLRGMLAKQAQQISDLQARLNQMMMAPRSPVESEDVADEEPAPPTDRMAAARAARAAKRAASA